MHMNVSCVLYFTSTNYQERKPALYLSTEVRLFKAVPVHDFKQIFQYTVEHLVKLFSNYGQWMLRRQRSCVQLHL